MSPSHADRDVNSSRMQLHSDMASPADRGTSEFAQQETVFIIGNHAFFQAVKRALDVAGGFHIVGAFKMDDLDTSLRRSTMLGQTPSVAVIHEPPGERVLTDDAAHGVLKVYPSCGIVLISGGELEAETERKMAVHDFNAIVVPESVIKNPNALAKGMHAAINEAGTAERVG